MRRVTDFAATLPALRRNAPAQDAQVYDPEDQEGYSGSQISPEGFDEVDLEDVSNHRRAAAVCAEPRERFATADVLVSVESVIDPEAQERDARRKTAKLSTEVLFPFGRTNKTLRLWASVEICVLFFAPLPLYFALHDFPYSLLVFMYLVGIPGAITSAHLVFSCLQTQTLGLSESINDDSCNRNGILSLWKLINRIYVVLWGCGIVAQLGWIFASGYKTHDLGWIFVALIYNIIVWPFFFITWHVGREIDSPFDRSVAQVERNPPTIELALASAAPALIVVEAQPESAAGDADAGDADASDGNFQRALSASAAAADADAPADAALDAAPDAAPAAAAAVATQL